MLIAHLGGLRAAPLAYATAAWWRLCGKKLRARAQFARLLGVSTKAYQLWLLDEPPAPRAGDDGAPIVALVAAGADRGRLDETLDSLASEDIPALVLGSPEAPDLAGAARGIDWQGGPWLMPLVAGDVLRTGTAAAYRGAMAEATAALIYADDDLRGAAGARTAPYFKPEWNSELFPHHDYLTGACVIRTTAEELGALDGPDWAARLVAAKVGAGQGAPHHVPHILHHRLVRPAPRVPAAVAASVQGLPSVTVIVPTRNRLDLLSACLRGLEATDYPELDVIVVDNGSDDPATLAYLATLDPARHRVLRQPGPFNFSTLNNHAVAEARGQLLCLLNNDIEVIEPTWLATMARQAQRPDVGAVGARLLYPDGRIQHAGVVLGVGGGAAHAHRLLRPEAEGYFRRHALPQFVSAVTAACLVVARERFVGVGGLDEQNFAVAFNDVDLCLRLNARGWQSLYEPRATLIHHESVSRGFDRDRIGAARLAGELAALKRLWGTGGGVDPFHHPALSPFSEQFVVRL